MGFPPLCGEKRDELMTYYDAGQYDIAVIGAGHAGIEAALAAARMGLRTVCFTINLDAVGNMPVSYTHLDVYKRQTVCSSSIMTILYTLSWPLRHQPTFSREPDIYFCRYR